MSESSALPSEASGVTAPGVNPGALVPSGPIRLRAAFGQDEANHGTARFSVDGDGLICVPREVAYPLLTVGGFALADKVGNLEAFDVVRLRHEDAAACSYAGRQYRCTANGDVIVPADAAAELWAHGFVPAIDGASGPLAGEQGTPKRRSLKDWSGGPR